MATEIKPRGASSVQGEQLALSTSINAVRAPAGRDGVALAGVVLYCTGDFRFQICPALRRVLKTTDNAVTYTDATDSLRDRDVASVLTLDSLDTYANGDYVLVASDRKFGGINVDVGNANGNASVMTVKYYKSNGTWADITATDGTVLTGATLGQDGNITWTVPSDWAETTINGTKGYFVRIEVSAALDASVTVREVCLLSKDANRGYAYSGYPVTVPLSSADGGIEALVAAATATLDITWSFGNVIGV